MENGLRRVETDGVCELEFAGTYPGNCTNPAFLSWRGAIKQFVTHHDGCFAVARAKNALWYK